MRPVRAAKPDRPASRPPDPVSVLVAAVDQMANDLSELGEVTDEEVDEARVALARVRRNRIPFPLGAHELPVDVQSRVYVAAEDLLWLAQLMGNACVEDFDGERHSFIGVMYDIVDLLHDVLEGHTEAVQDRRATPDMANGGVS